MLNLIYASCSGRWELYLSCIEEVIPWAFAYDRQNYARYLIPFLKNIRHLCVRTPETYAAHNKGKFSVQVGGGGGGAGGWGVIILDETKLTRLLRTTLVATSRREEATSGFRRDVYNKLLREYLSLISSPT